MPPEGGKGAVCIAGGHAPVPIYPTFHGMNRQTGERNFFEKRIFPEPEGKGGMNHESDGVSGVADVRIHHDLRNR